MLIRSKQKYRAVVIEDVIMTTKYFLCLANSKKYTQRCIAGIEAVPTVNNGFRIVRRRDGTPVWIRPVSESDTGEVAEASVKQIRLLDIVRFDGFVPRPYAHQQENCSCSETSFAVTRAAPAKPDFLDKLAVTTSDLFGDTHHAIAIENATTLCRSLVFIKAISPQPHFAPGADDRVQTRMRFCYADVEYDLPITDIEFRKAFYDNCFVLRGKQHVYLTISLGQPYNGHYYKLIAGVIAC